MISKKTSWLFAVLIGSFAPLLQAGGPWLVYKGPSKTEGGFLVLNLGYDNGPQFSTTEFDDYENTTLQYRLDAVTKKFEIFKLTWDADNTSPSSIKNAWHRTSWGREGNTFIILYSQYEVVGPSGVADHGVGFGIGSCVQWPSGTKSIGVAGKYPLSLNFQLLRLDGLWQGAALGTGSRQVKPTKVKATLDVALTKDLNDARGGLDTNAEAKDWIIDYLVNQRGYVRGVDEIRD